MKKTYIFVVFVIFITSLIFAEDSINIVPFPRQCKIEGKINLDSGKQETIIVIENLNKAKIGADEINSKLKSLGKEPLLIKLESEIGKDDLKKYNTILIGSIERSKLIK